jgi:hypothetical protein
MKRESDPIGPDNDRYILETVRETEKIICAWGAQGGHMNRDVEVLKMLKFNKVDLHCLGTTKKGQPKHPLYLRADLKPQLFEGQNPFGK